MIRKLRVTWHLFWFRWHLDRQEVVKAQLHRAALREVYETKGDR